MSFPLKALNGFAYPLVRMPKGFPIHNCRNCGRHETECGILSATKLCRPCGDAISTDNYVGLTTRSGPYWRLWRKRMAASVGAVLLDDDGERV